ncbi:MAG: hypothetical protein IJT52_04650 [Spirochaetales bacterium]|nr:hypothetical protein [Spirochaetales bacterium]
MGVIRLYHTGFSIIEKPDIKAGRTNADFVHCGTIYVREDRFSRLAFEKTEA